MTLKAKTSIFPALVAVIAIVTATSVALYYRGNAIDYKAQRDKSKDELELANATISDMQTRQRNVAALDAKYTQELADAKATIDLLHDDVIAGKRRLQLSATCPNQSTTGSSSLDDAASPRLTDSAERDYFTLRERIEVAGKQISGLQQYITEQCLR